MKIGILTLHGYMNYGSIAQVTALSGFLKERGHDVLVIDRWMGGGKEPIVGSFGCWNVVKWLRLFVKSFLKGWGNFQRQIRGIKTQQYIRKKLPLTPYHFSQWKELNFKVDFDRIIVGSDQVWSGGVPANFEPYVFHGYRYPVSAISYAASFGVSSLPEIFIEQLKNGLARFSALSAREERGVEMLKNLGFTAERTVDPVLLVPRSSWGGGGSRSGRILVYMMEENAESIVSEISEQAIIMNKKIDVLVDHYYGSLTALRHRNVSVHLTAGPSEFVDFMRNAEAVVTDSFHGLCFSSIFDKNVRFVRPQLAYRKAEFSRIETFAKNYVIGDMFVDSFAEGVADLPRRKIEFRQDVIEADRQRSANWLINALEERKGV